MSVDENKAPWRDGELLFELYHKQNLSQKKIANKLGCTTKTVRKWMRKNEIKTRSGGSQFEKYARFGTDTKGYEHWFNVRSSKWEGATHFPVHRLLAISKYGPENVAGNVIHHKNGIRWDNREENIEVLSQSDHCKTHEFGLNSKYSEFDKALIAALHNGTKKQMELLGEAIDANPAHLYDITSEYRNE